MTSSQKVTQSVRWLRNVNFSLEIYNFTTSQWILSISWISTAKWCFPINLRYKSENLNKIWKFKNPRWRPPVTPFIFLLLPWRPIRHHVVTLNWKYKWSLLHAPSFKSIGWIVSIVEGGVVRLPPPPPPPRLRVTIFSSKLLGLKNKIVKVFKKNTCDGLGLP